MPETEYQSIDEFYEDKDEMIGRHWLDPEDYRQVQNANEETGLVIAVVTSIAIVLGVAAGFFGIIWIVNQIPSK